MIVFIVQSVLCILIYTEYVWTPFALQVSFTTVQCRATSRCESQVFLVQ